MPKRPSPSMAGRPSPSKSSVKPCLDNLAQPSPSKGGSPLTHAVNGWLGDGRANGHSQRTLANRRHLMARFEWWLVNEQEAEPALSSLSPAVIRAFMTYLREERPEGRFGHLAKNGNNAGTARPSTVHTYYRCLRAFVNWCRAEEWIESTPLKNVKAPRVPEDALDHFSEPEMQALVNAARHNQTPNRDVAIILVLLDTGMRAGELCGLNVRDAEQQDSALTVLGKGNKKRKVYMSRTARLALWNYLHRDRNNPMPDEPLFVARGGGRFSPNSLTQFVERTARHAGLKGAAGCHKIRRTFAISFLRQGGNLFELQRLMGHTDLTVLRRYVKYAETDLAATARRHSPVDGMNIR